MQRELGKADGGLRDAVFTARERVQCAASHNPACAFAVCFAIKEALWKALGTGWAGGLSWQEIEVEASSARCARVTLSGATRSAADQLGVQAVHASFSTTSRLALATVVLEA